MAPLATETKEPLHPVAKFFSQLFGAFCMLTCTEAALEDRVTVRDRTRAPPYNERLRGPHSQRVKRP